MDSAKRLELQPTLQRIWCRSHVAGDLGRFIATGVLVVGEISNLTIRKGRPDTVLDVAGSTRGGRATYKLMGNHLRVEFKVVVDFAEGPNHRLVFRYDALLNAAPNPVSDL